MHNLTDALVLDALKYAKALNLEQSFIKLLEQEAERRDLTYKMFFYNSES